MYSVNDVAEWSVIAIIVIGFIMAFVRVRNWWWDRFGNDPLDRWKKK